MATKNRIVYLMQYLQENSDENHPVTTAEIREEMARRGCPIIISTLRDDIESLRSTSYYIQANKTEKMVEKEIAQKLTAGMLNMHSDHAI